ncbi:MAG: PD-(D/E)XK nuclease family protein [Cyanobacteria bacterium SIG26]|nr:PD-(D/E)XK nuclease family protein [Cyanobacteria bacterium SIG26]
MTILSPNMLKTYQTCPKLYKFRYIDKLNIPTSNTPFEKGKKIHALANYFLQGVNISRIETVLNENEKEIWQTLLDNPFFRKKHFQSEYQLSCKIDKFWIGGRLDAIVQDGENYYILDYKTGSIPKSPEYDYQTMVYLLCVDKFLKGNYDSLSFVYINLKTKTNYVINFNNELKNEYQNKLLEICTKIAKDSIYRENHNSCSNCNYINKC